MIAILLSTYNGENYLREQLDSVFKQNFSDFILYVRDDGSTDSTISIILEYEKLYSNFIFFKDNAKNRGASESFMWLLRKVESDYYMFCDQDDVWFSSKVKICLEIVQAEEQRSINKCILVHTDLMVTDSKLNVISNSLWSNDKISPLIITRKYLRLVNYVTGCTMFFNRNARDLSLTSNINILMHDFWIAMSVDSAKGVIISLPVPTMYYRQHGKNVVGASKKRYRFPALQRYIHLPDFNYSRNLYKMIKSRYSMSLLEYILLRVKFYLKV